LITAQPITSISAVEEPVCTFTGGELLKLQDKSKIKSKNSKAQQAMR
jgi:hypothetical protein